jgi:YidC/Oxa1 family membrane protein insertase
MVFTLFARLLEMTYRIWPSYGGSIVLFTIIIMLLLTPLTLKGTRSMLALQQLQPEMKKLQNRYKDDRQKLNEEMMKFYQENKISPLGGCLPMLIQLPIFFILYQVLLGLTRRGPYASDMGSSVTCHVGGTGTMCHNGIVPTAGYFDPKYISHTSKLYLDLSNTRQMMSWGIDLSQSVLKSFHQGVEHAAPYIILVVLVVATTYFQQVQIQRRTPPSAVNPTQQLTMKIMPVAMGVIYLLIPAGVVVYFLVSNLFRIGQQALVTRTVYAPAGAIPTTARAVDDEEPAKKKSFRDNFIPSESALPRVGKRAGGSTAIDTTAKTGGGKPAGKGSTATKAAGASKKAAPSNGKARASGATKSASGSQRSASGSTRSSSGSTRSKVTPPASKSRANNGAGGPNAPTRKSPAPPPNRSKKKN